MIEIERKFLVQFSQLPDLTTFENKRIVQGYLQNKAECTVRVRISNEIAFLTIKGKSENISRQEFEYEIPKNEANDLLKLCGDKVVTKTRYLIPIAGKTWELDIFTDKLEGLILAEIELNSESESFETPKWLKEEVSFDSRFYNSNLSTLSEIEARELVLSLT